MSANGIVTFKYLQTHPTYQQSPNRTMNTIAMISQLSLIQGDNLHTILKFGVEPCSLH